MRNVALLAVSLALAAAASCAKQAPPRCPGESNEVQRDTRVRVTTLANPKDPTAGGKLTGPASTGERPMKAVLLLDYSGSMWGGYDRAPVGNCATCKGAKESRNGQPYHYALPEFHSLLAQLIDASVPAGADVAMRALLFNKDVWQFDDKGSLTKLDPSSATLDFPWRVSSMSSAQIAQGLAAIPGDPYKGTAKSANETHMKPALELAVKSLLAQGSEGIVWLVTDNIADHSGGNVSADDARRNLEFYQMLNADPRLQLVYAYPMHDEQQCTWLCGSSLFIYAIHVASTQRAPADEANRLSGGHLGAGPPSKDGLLWNDRLQAATSTHAGKAKPELAGVPLRLKPMDLNAVGVSFLSSSKSGKLEPLKCKRTSEFGETTPCLATIVVKNNLRHERVDSAVVSFTNDVLLPHTKDAAARLPWASSVCPGQIKTRPAKKGAQVDEDARFPIGPLDPGAEQRLDVVMLVPAVQVAPTAVGEIVDVAFTEQLLLEGQMSARVDDIKTSLVVPPEDRAKVYGADNLPTIFVSRNESEVQALFPAIVPVHNDGKLQALLLLVLVGGGVLLLALLLFRFQPAFCTVLVDGVEHAKLRLPRLSSQKVEVKGGVVLGRVRRGVGFPEFVPAKGATARRAGSAWVVSPPGGGGLEQRVELRQGWRSKAKADAAASGF